MSKLNIEKRPQNLFVDRNLFPDILTSDGMNQWVESKNVESKNLLGILSSLVIGNLQISPTAFVMFVMITWRVLWRDTRTDLPSPK